MLRQGVYPSNARAALSGGPTWLFAKPLKRVASVPSWIDWVAKPMGVTITLDNSHIGSKPDEETTTLPEIPVLDVGIDWPFETLEREFERINAMLDEGSGRIPKPVMKIADAVSRRWLERSNYPYLAEIDRIAARIARPGAYFLNLSYEWGCTSSVGPSPDGWSSRLMRVLDWPDRGLGRYIIAARIHCDAGAWLTLTWPGYTGVLQAISPGRFAAALKLRWSSRWVFICWIGSSIARGFGSNPISRLRTFCGGSFSAPATLPKPKRCYRKRRSPCRRFMSSRAPRPTRHASSSVCGIEHT